MVSLTLFFNDEYWS